MPELSEYIFSTVVNSLHGSLTINKTEKNEWSNEHISLYIINKWMNELMQTQQCC